MACLEYLISPLIYFGPNSYDKIVPLLNIPANQQSTLSTQVYKDISF